MITSNIVQAFVNFSCMFLKPNYFFQFEFKKNSDLSLFFYGSQNFCQLLACSLEFQTFFSISRIIFPLRRSEQFWKQNTIHSHMYLLLELQIDNLDIFFQGFQEDYKNNNI